MQQEDETAGIAANKCVTGANNNALHASSLSSSQARHAMATTFAAITINQ